MTCPSLEQTIDGAECPGTPPRPHPIGSNGSDTTVIEAFPSTAPRRRSRQRELLHEQRGCLAQIVQGLDEVHEALEPGEILLPLDQA